VLRPHPSHPRLTHPCALGRRQGASVERMPRDFAATSTTLAGFAHQPPPAPPAPPAPPDPPMPPIALGPSLGKPPSPAPPSPAPPMAPPPAGQHGPSCGKPPVPEAPAPPASSGSESEHAEASAIPPRTMTWNIRSRLFVRALIAVRRPVCRRAIWPSSHAPRARSIRIPDRVHGRLERSPRDQLADSLLGGVGPVTPSANVIPSEGPSPRPSSSPLSNPELRQTRTSSRDRSLSTLELRVWRSSAGDRSHPARSAPLPREARPAPALAPAPAPAPALAPALAPAPDLISRP
jgi:hypothetical protein